MRAERVVYGERVGTAVGVHVVDEFITRECDGEQVFYGGVAVAQSVEFLIHVQDGLHRVVLRFGMMRRRIIGRRGFVVLEQVAQFAVEVGIGLHGLRLNPIMLIVADSRGFFRAGEQGAAAFAESSLAGVRGEILKIRQIGDLRHRAVHERLDGIVAFVDGLLQPEGIHAQRDASDLLAGTECEGGEDEPDLQIVFRADP